MICFRHEYESKILFTQPSEILDNRFTYLNNYTNVANENVLTMLGLNIFLEVINKFCFPMYVLMGQLSELSDMVDIRIATFSLSK